jgi:hypothetical protein
MFAEALAAFRVRSWDEAAEKFRGCMESLPGDEPSRFYMGLCEQHKNRPPVEPWDGVVAMDAK